MYSVVGTQTNYYFSETEPQHNECSFIHKQIILLKQICLVNQKHKEQPV